MRHSTKKINVSEWDKFWRWEILIEVEKFRTESWVTYRLFKCKCKCWTIRNLRLKLLKSGESKSCWCLHKEIIGMGSKTHWMSTTKIYKVFSVLKDRCNNSLNQSYKNYWWRGIKCLWNNFEDFYKDMWESYKEWLSIDRINNDWNYCKNNCRWATRRTQANNTRNVHHITHNWETNSIAEWARILNKNVNTLRVRVHRWKSIFN